MLRLYSAFAEISGFLRTFQVFFAENRRPYAAAVTFAEFAGLSGLGPRTFGVRFANFTAA
jgi:hypothetical protein